MGLRSLKWLAVCGLRGALRRGGWKRVLLACGTRLFRVCAVQGSLFRGSYNPSINGGLGLAMKLEWCSLPRHMSTRQCAAHLASGDIIAMCSSQVLQITEHEPNAATLE